MRFVPIKTVESQAILAVHRARQGFVKARTAQANQIRGLLAEYGIVIPQGITHIPRRLPEILEDGANDLPLMFRALLVRLGDHLKTLDQQVQELEGQIQACHRQNDASRRLEQIPGIGPITASALVASVGDASSFQNSRQLAAFLGLVPRQHSSGGKPSLLGISKRGDVYLRTLLIHGARAVVRGAQHKTDPEAWLGRLLGRRPRNVATVRWPTRTHVPSGRSWPAGRTTDRTLVRRRPTRNRTQILGPQTEVLKEVLHRLLRHARRDGTTGQTVTGTTRLLQRAYPPENLIEEPVSGFHQGPRRTPHSESECMAAIFTCRSS